MARGDVKAARSSGSGSRGGSGSHFYDDQGRGSSKSAWEWFESSYTAANFQKSWLMSLDDQKCYWLLKSSTERYGLVDIAYVWAPGWREFQDSRAHRLVLKHLTEKDWCDFHSHMVDCYNRQKEKMEQERKEAADKRDKEYAAYEAIREAQRAVVQREDYEQVQQIVAPTVGMFEAEFNSAFKYADRVGDAGDWIESSVEVYMDGTGYGYETSKATGVKLQIAVALDLSNSMYYNGVHIAAAESFRNLCLTLEELKGMYQGDLFTSYWTFSLDYYEGSGRRVDQLIFRNDAESQYDMKAMKEYAPSRIREWYGKGPFYGEDTWISPLFTSIERWEKEESDPGALKLDIVITDAVLEHPMDIREADKVQERRDGTLSSVLLNFLPVKDWVNSTLPRRCFQMAVDKDNVAGILRQVLMEFVSVRV